MSRAEIFAVQLFVPREGRSLAFRRCQQQPNPQEELINPVTRINLLSIKPQKVDELFELDQSHVASASLPKGLIGSRLYRSMDGKSVVRVSQYESVEAHHDYHHSEALREQIGQLRPLVESSSSALYEEVYTTGDFK